MIRAVRRQRGLTLLEMLVVLMISGMALALGFQSLGQWRRADTAISTLSQRSQQTLLTQRWLHDSLRSLTPIAEVPFKGSDIQLAGISLNAVISSQGGETPVSWQLANDPDGMALVLVEAERELRMPLRDVESGTFRYIDDKGVAHDQWPPALGISDALPSAVLLELTDTAGRTQVWGAAVAGIRNPVKVLYEIEDF